MCCFVGQVIEKQNCELRSLEKMRKSAVYWYLHGMFFESNVRDLWNADVVLESLKFLPLLN